MKFGLYTSICKVCYAKGYFTKQEKCTRSISVPCDCCGSYENATMKQCTGKNIMIDYKDCDKKFIPYYENGKRIKVKFSYGEVKSGTVGLTTGWKPVFLLMLRSNSTGSSYILSSKDIII